MDGACKYLPSAAVERFGGPPAVLLTGMAQFCGSWPLQRPSVLWFVAKNPAIWGNLDALSRWEPWSPEVKGNRHLSRAEAVSAYLDFYCP